MSSNTHPQPARRANRLAALLAALLAGVVLAAVFAAPAAAQGAPPGTDPPDTKQPQKTPDQAPPGAEQTTAEKPAPEKGASDEPKEKASEEKLAGGAKDDAKKTGAQCSGPLKNMWNIATGNGAGVMFSCMLKWAYEGAVVGGLEQAAETLTESAFTLPEPEGELKAHYDHVVSIVRPGVLAGILVLGLLTMVKSANFDVAFTTQHGLPKFVLVAAALVSFPEFMSMLSALSSSIAKGFLSDATIASAVQNLLGVDAMEALTGGGGFIAIVGYVALAIVALLVVAVVVFKNIMYLFLYLVGPVALILYPVPGFSNLAGIWFRAIVACAAIPLLYSLEITIGSWIVAAPELVFGPGGNMGAATPFAAVMVLWLMWKTPFRVLGWAFQGAPPSLSLPGSGAAKKLGRTAVGATVGAGIGAATAGPGGAIAGAAKGAGKGALQAATGFHPSSFKSSPHGGAGGGGAGGIGGAGAGASGGSSNGPGLGAKLSTSFERQPGGGFAPNGQSLVVEARRDFKSADEFEDFKHRLTGFSPRPGGGPTAHAQPGRPWADSPAGLGSRNFNHRPGGLGETRATEAPTAPMDPGGKKPGAKP